MLSSLILSKRLGSALSPSTRSLWLTRQYEKFGHDFTSRPCPTGRLKPQPLPSNPGMLLATSSTIWVCCCNTSLRPYKHQFKLNSPNDIPAAGFPLQHHSFILRDRAAPRPDQHQMPCQSRIARKENWLPCISFAQSTTEFLQTIDKVN